LARSLTLALLRRWGPPGLAVAEQGPDVPTVTQGRCDVPLTRLHQGGGAPNDDRPKASGKAVVVVRDQAFYQAFLLGGTAGLARAYALGWWDCEDLAKLMDLGAQHLPRPGSLAGYLTGLAGWCRALASSRHQAAKACQKAQVMAHYDLGDDFFASFLGPTMTYSCGIFERPGASMEEASVAKLRRACEKIGLKEHMQVLEVGGGWGSFALFAASAYGCQVTTTTVSPSQYAATKRLVAEAGLAHLIKPLEADYKQLSGHYDRLVSIEMVEALPWRELDQFFATCAGLLRPGGQMFLQAIVIAGSAYALAKRRRDFIKEVIFPGSNIPSLRALRRSAGRAGLEEVACERIGHHYVQTLTSWRDRFLAERGRLEERGYKEELLRLWDLYFAYCRAGFAVGYLDDVQLVLTKGQCTAPPARGRRGCQISKPV